MLTGELATLRTAKGGQSGEGRDIRNGLVTQVCRVRQGPGDQVEVDQDSKCRTGGRGRWDGSLFGQAVQDRNKGGKLGVKERYSSLSRWSMGGIFSTQRVKGADPENR